VAALRAAGLDPAPASRLVAVRDRLRELRYGPAAGPVPAELAREARDLLDALRPRAGGRSGALAAIAFLTALGGAPGLAGQTSDAARLYAAGSLHAAASALLRELDRDARDPAIWYNLGATYYRLGLDGRAAAAWLQAHRLAPRQRTVNRALDLVPPPEPASAARLWTPPVSWPELALAALPLWAAGWMLLAWRPRRRDVAIALVLLGGVAGVSALAICAREAHPVAIVVGGTPLQLSPHERAPTVTPLEAGSAVLLLRRQSGWTMVNAPGGRLGWVPTDSVFRLRSL
jgi:tetratricopeptide (TPR) repeat protein